MNKSEWQKKGVGHRDRMRDKFLERGIDAFKDDEILELLLTFGTPRRDCKDIARAALKKFNNSLPAVLDAPHNELKSVKGIGPKNIFALHFVQGVARRYLKQRIRKKQYLHSSKEVAAFLIHEMRNLDKEVFQAIFLDNSHAVIDSEIIAEGTINVNTIYPRELVKRALNHKAAAMVIAHNHPSGNVKPSIQDKKLTKSLYLVCSFMQIKLLDHLIVGSSEKVYSFADHGNMAEIAKECGKILS